MNRCRLFVAGAIGPVAPLGFIIAIVQAQIQQNAQIARGATLAAQGTPTGGSPCSHVMPSTAAGAVWTLGN